MKFSVSTTRCHGDVEDYGNLKMFRQLILLIEVIFQKVRTCFSEQISINRFFKTFLAPTHIKNYVTQLTKPPSMEKITNKKSR